MGGILIIGEGIPNGFPPPPRRCASCGHVEAAHDGLDDPERRDGWCLVNAHETATEAECECDGFVSEALAAVPLRTLRRRARKGNAEAIAELARRST